MIRQMILLHWEDHALDGLEYKDLEQLSRGWAATYVRRNNLQPITSSGTDIWESKVREAH